MKQLMQFLTIICLVALMAACNDLDNYDAPNKKFTGNIVYNGQPINVEKGQVRIQLWEIGWDQKEPIDVAVEPDGSFSAVLFNGDYKLVFPNNDGPFMKITNSETASDTILLNLRGSTEMDIEVIPYYILKSASYDVSASQLSVDFSIEKIISDANAKDIEYARLFINKGQFVSNGNNIRSATINGGDIADLDDVSLQLDIPAIVPAQQYVYARVGLKVAGVEDMIFSPVQKIEF
jgi:hypothetical protein